MTPRLWAMWTAIFLQFIAICFGLQLQATIFCAAALVIAGMTPDKRA